MGKSSKSQPTFEQAVEQLEQIIDQIESGEIGLEDALKSYEQGAKMIKRCQSIIDKAEKRIAELNVGDDGELSVGDVALSPDELTDDAS
ncbi:MAG: exodeoxyribonuclease VII small subunit [Phycisphaeraceae bacterium]|jgi:exodeoxyribonuclease VII small subunit|nr:exodeoxyribonuclease VII small subunit [Phycisphaeraceae bacterium]MDP7346616.1 exodeoxyribonuclease VII small subunit [Phycisphaeraceae bacterium]